MREGKHAPSEQKYRAIPISPGAGKFVFYLSLLRRLLQNFVESTKNLCRIEL